MFNNPNIFDELDADLNHINSLYPNLNDTNSSLYYSYAKLNHACSKDMSKFSIIHFNIRSILPKIDEIRSELSLLEFPFSVLCFTESWLTDQLKNLVSFDRYDAFHNLRVDRRGGGISVFVSKEFKTNILSDYTVMTEHFESLFIELRSDYGRIVVGTIYRPPAGNLDAFLDNLEVILSSIEGRHYMEIVITGDFNLDLLKCTDDPTIQMFLNTLYAYSLLPVISKPTRITDYSATLLDNIFIKNPINYIAGSIISSLSDHYPVFCIFNNVSFKHKCPSQLNYTYRKINYDSMSSLYESLNCYDFSDVLDCRDVNIAVTRLDNIMYDHFNVFCPVVNKTVSPKNVTKPWITRDILSLIKRRQNLFILVKTNKITKVAFNRYRNFVTSKIRIAKEKYFEDKFDAYKSNIKRTWNLINKLINPSSNSNKCTIEKVIYNNVHISDKDEIASAFNHFFVNVGSEIANSIDSHPDNHKMYLQGNYPNSFFFSPVSDVEVANVICSLKDKPSHFNSVPTKVLKFIRRLISPLLASIINKSIEDGIFPDSLKIAKIIPIFKQGDKYEIQNYRPISLLPLLSKLFEKVAHNQLVNFLNSNDIIFNHQYGFRAGKSPDNAIADFLKYTYEALDSDFCVFSVFLDFKKAFDSVDHNILLNKLYHYGVRGVPHKWFHSYLTNRQQYVSIQDSSSEQLRITHGVPQGSILGPLLFLIFINDFPFCTPFFNFILYADDSTLSCKFPRSELNVFHTHINVHLEFVNRWLAANKIAINAQKTKYIIFSYRQSLQLDPIYIGGSQIEGICSTKFLGLNVDNNLNFHSHVDYISNKISKSVGILYKLNFLPSSILIKLYQSLVQPYITYGLIAYFGCSKSYLNKLIIIQKRCIRAINKLNYREHTNEYFLSNKILKLEDQHVFQIAIYMFKTLKFNFDPNLFICLNYQNQLHNHETRYSYQLTLPRLRASTSENNIAYCGVKLWNSLPESIKNLFTVKMFKNSLKVHILSSY